MLNGETREYYWVKYTKGIQVEEGVREGQGIHGSISERNGIQDLEKKSGG